MVSHGHSPSYIASMSDAQLMALHNSDHNSGSVTGSGQQRWPVSYGAQSYGTPNYYSGSPCPNGMCPR
jgi:hypothetical protein